MNDDIRNALIALSSLVPNVGGMLSFILDKYIPSEAERRKNEFLCQLQDDIEQLKSQVDFHNLESPEFQAIFTRLLRASMEEHRQEKITAFRNIIVKLILNPDSPNLNVADFYSRLVLMLIPDEIKLLHLFYTLDVKKELVEYDSSEQRSIYSIIKKLWGNIDYDYLTALLTDCQRYQLISGSHKQEEKYSRKGVFLTNLGAGFLEFIFEPAEEVKDAKQER